MRMLGRYSWRRGRCPCCGDSKATRTWKRIEERQWRREWLKEIW